MKPKKSIELSIAYETPLFEEKGYLKLDSNENVFGPSSKVISAIQNITADEIKFYPFYGELLEKIAEFHNTKIENIILTAGADEAISAIFGTFLEEKMSVLTVAPSFVMPKIYSKLKNLNYIEVEYENKWQFPKNEFIKRIADADLIHLTTPNSPTGEIIDKDTISKIISVTNDKAVLIDETYANYSDISHSNLIKTNPNVFVVRSFSKDFALAGLRLGYIISAEENIKQLRKYLSPYNVSAISVKAGIAALDDIDYFKKIKSEIEESKKFLTDELEKTGAVVYPSATNFICVDFKEKADFIYKKLYFNKIKVKNLSQIPLMKNCLRIAIPKLEDCHRIIKILKPRPMIVFDMDGVLIDASKSYRVAVQKTFKNFSGSEVLPEEISAAKKMGGLNNDWDLTDYLLKQRNINIEYDKIVDVFQAYYNELADIEEPLVNHKILSELSKRFDLAIFTGRLKEEAEFTLKKHDFIKYFNPIITMQDVGLDHQKPDNLGLELIKKNTITDKIYYLGDTIDDMTCAQRSKVDFIGVLPPQDKSESLKTIFKNGHAVVILENTSELINFLEGIYAKQ